ncbi:MAG: hypothetical protein ACLRIT_12090 [Blautia sp.]
MGVSSIREFALPLMVGIVCGAYSSVCITGCSVACNETWLLAKTCCTGCSFKECCAAAK